MKNNIGTFEQLFSIGIRSGLVAFGLSKRPKEGILPILVGGGLLLHGLSNHSRLYDAIGIDEYYRSPIRQHLNRSVHFRKSISINRSPSEIYAYWRNLQNLPRFMQGILAVQEHDEKRSRCYARGPLNTEFYWKAEILEDLTNEMIKWRTIETESNLEHEGTFSLRPAPGNRGTILTLDCRWSPPGGVFGAAAAKLLPQDLARQVSEDLRRFRQLMEAGEITRNHKTTYDSDPSGLAQHLREVTDELGITDPVPTEHRF